MEPESKQVSDKVDFKPKLVKRNKESHFILIDGTISQKEITIANIYVANFGMPNFIKQILLNLQAQTDPNTVTVEDFHSPLLAINKSSSIPYS